MRLVRSGFVRFLVLLFITPLLAVVSPGQTALASPCTFAGGTLTANTTITNLCGTYNVQSSITVPTGITLTIQPGVTLAFPLGQYLTVQGGGTLVADASASPSTPIVFTTASVTPAPGQWGGIVLYSGSTANLKYADIQYAGAWGLDVETNLTTLDHLSLLSNAGTGLRVYGAVNVTVTSSNFENSPPGTGITDPGLEDYGGAVDARGNYWNSSSGPTVAGFPGGAGDSIVGNSVGKVNFGGFTCLPITSAGATPCNTTVGGANLTLTTEAANKVLLGWSMVGIQDGYDVLRINPSGAVVLPPALPTTASSFTDAVSPTAYDLYAVLPLHSGGAVLGISDLLGYLPNLQSASGVPAAFTLTLRQSAVATLTWTAPGGQTGYTLFAIPTDGSATRTQDLPANALSATDNTGGKPTIYVLAALSGQALLGNTDGLLAFPGVATVSAPNQAKAAQRAALAPTALPTTRAQLRAKAQAAQQQLARPQLRAALQQLLHRAAPATTKRAAADRGSSGQPSRNNSQ